eukprot:jgi/Tetstr1/431998/TSEL_021474.t1
MALPTPVNGQITDSAEAASDYTPAAGVAAGTDNAHAAQDPAASGAGGYGAPEDGGVVADVPPAAPVTADDVAGLQANLEKMLTERRPRSEHAARHEAHRSGTDPGQLLDVDRLTQLIRHVVHQEVPNGLSALQQDVLDLHGDMVSLKDFIAGTGHREASANTKLLQIEEAQATQWDQWKQRIAELRNAILEHPNVDSSALGIFDRDALEDALESARMATIAGQEAKAESTRMTKQMISMLDRMEVMEGRMAAVKGPDAETQALTARLKRDMEAVLAKSENIEGANKALQAQLSSATSANEALVREVQELRLRIAATEEGSTATAAKLDERLGSLSEAVTTTKTAIEQIGTASQEERGSLKSDIDKVKQELVEVNRQVTVVGPHTMEVLRGELEGMSARLDQVQVSVPAAVAPVKDGLSMLQEKLAAVEIKKLDAADAVNEAMLDKSVARAVDSADRKVNLVMSAIASIEERMEMLNNDKADRNQVALQSEMEVMEITLRSAIEHESQKLETRMEESNGEKVSLAMLDASDKKSAQKIGQLEGAILRGLKAISDRVAAALLEKADAMDLNDFRMQMKGILSEIDIRLRELSPSARMVASGPNARGTHCMSCDQQVRSSKDVMTSAAYSLHGVTGSLPMDEKMFPAKLPAMKSWHNSYAPVQDAEPRGASYNAKAANQRAQRDNVLRSPAVNPHQMANSHTLPSTPPAGAVPKSSNLVYGDSISGTIARGQLPSPSRVPPTSGGFDNGGFGAPGSPGTGSRAVATGRLGLEVAGFASNMEAMP